MTSKKRGPKAKRSLAEDEVASLRGQVSKIEHKLSMAQEIISAQKKQKHLDAARRRIGDPDGRRDLREKLIKDVEDLAPKSGLRQACDALGVSRSLVYTRRRPAALARPRARRSPPPRALRADERGEILALLGSERFVDKAPAEVVAILLKEGRYVASARTMYRILAEARQQVPR